MNSPKQSTTHPWEKSLANATLQVVRIMLKEGLLKPHGEETQTQALAYSEISQESGSLKTTLQVKLTTPTNSSPKSKDSPTSTLLRSLAWKLNEAAENPSLITVPVEDYILWQLQYLQEVTLPAASRKH